MSSIFDTHSHIQFAAFDDDRDAVIDRARASGVEHIVACGDDVPTTEAAFALAARYPGTVLPTAGIHPHEAASATPEVLADIERWAGHPACAAVGEIGLDFFRELSPREAQLRVLDRQLEMAITHDLPVIIHSRGAEDFAISPLADYAAGALGLRSKGRPVGVMHCFGGTLDQARAYVELGFLISLACPVTYPRNEEARAIAAGIPLESLVVETDSPFLPPHGRRGERNEPAWVAAAVSEIARVRGISAENAADATAANARLLFAIPVPRETVTS